MRVMRLIDDGASNGTRVAHSRRRPETDTSAQHRQRKSRDSANIP